jgi:hypothetical protein
MPVVALGLAGCFQNPMSSTPTPLPIERITPPGGEWHSGLTDPTRRVIRDAKTFETVWASAYGSNSALPAVDFTREAVVVVAMGTKGSGGFSILVREVTVHGQRVEVAVDLVGPGSGCGVPWVVTQPTDMVTMPAPIGMTEFRDQQIVHDCD